MNIQGRDGDSDARRTIARVVGRTITPRAGFSLKQFQAAGSEYKPCTAHGIRIFQCEKCGLSICRDINAAINIRVRGFPSWDPRGREGHYLVFPDAVRYTNLCCKTRIGPGRAMQADTAEQYHLDILST